MTGDWDAAPATRIITVGQWLGTSNRITSLTLRDGYWIARDATTATYSQRDLPDGLKTWDVPTPGPTAADPTPWPPVPHQHRGRT